MDRIEELTKKIDALVREADLCAEWESVFVIANVASGECRISRYTRTNACLAYMAFMINHEIGLSTKLASSPQPSNNEA